MEILKYIKSVLSYFPPLYWCRISSWSLLGVFTVTMAIPILIKRLNLIYDNVVHDVTEISTLIIGHSF